MNKFIKLISCVGACFLLTPDASAHSHTITHSHTPSRTVCHDVREYVPAYHDRYGNYVPHYYRSRVVCEEVPYRRRSTVVVTPSHHHHHRPGISINLGTHRPTRVKVKIRY